MKKQQIILAIYYFCIATSVITLTYCLGYLIFKLF